MVVSRVLPELYSAQELASAAEVPLAEVEALIASGEIASIGGRFVAHADAVAWGRPTVRSRAAAGIGVASAVGPLRPEKPSTSGLFERRGDAPREPALPAAISAAAHLLLGVVAVLITTAGLDSAGTRTELRVEDPARLIFLALPGPGG